MTELFLAIVTLLTTLTKGNDRPVALIYCLISHVAYYCSFILPTGVMFHFMASCEAFLVIMLVCFKGCSYSRLTDLLIPTSLFSVLLDVYGWNVYLLDRPLDIFNNAIIVYYAIIISIFIYAVARHDAVYSGVGRFLRDNRNYRNLLGEAHKC
jgi:hypothetical protein